MSACCALCRGGGALRFSHILPEFFYKLVYDHKPRRFHIVSTEPDAREAFGQKGLRERLLCDACEQKFSGWERYAKETFVNSRGLQVIQQSDRIILRNLDYRIFKLFLLSLLWRMSVSTLDFFKEVSLGAHGEKIRMALLSEDPLEVWQYPCFIAAIQLGGKACTDWISEPSFNRKDGYDHYWIIITGLMFNFYVADNAPPRELIPLFLNQQNEMPILVKEVHEIPCVEELVQRFGQAINARKAGR